MTQAWKLKALPELKKLSLGLLACIALTFVFHWPSLKNGYIWDDDRYVTQNIELRSLDGLKHIWFKIDSEPQYYPLTHTTFWVEYQLWSLNPVGYHFDNMLIHIAYNNLGNLYNLKDKRDQAVESYTKTLNLKPNFEYAHFNLAGVYRRMGLLNKSLAHYDETVQLFAQHRSLNPSSRLGIILPEAHNNMGLIFTSMGRFDLAAQHLSVAIRLRTDYAEANNNLGNAYLRQSRLCNKTLRPMARPWILSRKTPNSTIIWEPHMLV